MKNRKDELDWLKIPISKMIRAKIDSRLGCGRCNSHRRALGYETPKGVYCRLCVRNYKDEIRMIERGESEGCQALNNGLSAGRIKVWGRGCR